jgi:hypothetical protein
VVGWVFSRKGAKAQRERKEIRVFNHETHENDESKNEKKGAADV